MPDRRPVRVARLSELEDRRPAYALVAEVDLVVVRFDDQIRVFYGRCLHRGALMSDGHVRGDDLICGVHDWDYRLDSGVSAYDNREALPRFGCWIEGDDVLVDENEIADWAREHPQPYDRESYLGLYQEAHANEDEPHTGLIRELARHRLKNVGHHGPMGAMGVSRRELPLWDDLQILTAQLHRLPLLDDEPVDTSFTLGPRAAKPLTMAMPLFVSDMSYGALSEEAKVALARGAEAAGVGICSGEGGMLPEEQAANSRYLYELASGRFGWSLDKVEGVQAFHFKAGQGAKTGTGGHLPGHKVTAKIAEVRGLRPGEPAVSPARFPELRTAGDFAAIAAEVRERSGGIPIGFKLSAQHVEKDIDFALEAGADYIILDGRGGGTGAAPLLFRDHISVPTLAALPRARRHLDASGASDVTLVVTGGLRVAPDFVKALALGADAIAVSNSALQAIGCLGMRACNTDNCPVGIATQKESLRRRLKIESSAQQLTNFLEATRELMMVLARACGHARLSEFTPEDLSTFRRELSDLTGVRFAGIGG